MARTRIELDALLRSTLGSDHVYYDPPEGFKLKFPCIVYHDSGRIITNADNDIYFKMRRYMLIYITKDADDSMVDTLEELQYCRLRTPYTADNKFHYPYDIDF